MQEEVYTGPTQILAIMANHASFGVQVDDKGVTADEFGRKIIPAGTPIGGDNDWRADEQAVLTTSNDAKAQGVLEHAVDVTSGQGNATMLVNGYVNENRLPAGLTISAEAKQALDGRVVFVKRNK